MGNWSPETVHDCALPCAICILIAELMRVWTCRAWKPMRKAGRRLFRQLGRSGHTGSAEWVQKLGSPAESRPPRSLKSEGQVRAGSCRGTKAPHESFDRKQWRLWSREQSESFRHVLRISPLVKLLRSKSGRHFGIRIATRRKMVGAASPITGCEWN